MIRGPQSFSKNLASTLRATLVGIALSWGAAATVTSCNQVFYQPMKEIVATPDQLDVAWSSVKVAISQEEQIAAWHLKSSTKPIAVVLQLHGNAENRSTHMFFVGWMAKAGCDVITFDYRGYGDSDGWPSRKSTVEDAATMIKWVKANPALNGLPLVIVGQSLGGAVAIPAVAWYERQRAQETSVDGLILDSTFSSYRRITRQKLASFWFTWPLQWPLSFLVTDDFSPIADAKEIKVPVLQFHSKNDHVVPYELGRELFDAIASGQKEFVDVKSSGHTVAFGVDGETNRTKIIKFIENLARKPGQKT